MDAEAFAMPGCTTPPNDRTRRPSSNLLSKEDNEASEVDSTTIRPHVASHGTKKLSPKPGEGPFVPDEVVLTDSKSPVSQRDRHNSHAKPFQLEKLIQDTSQPVFDDPKRVDSGYGGSHHSFSLTNPSVETEQSGDVILNRQKQSGLETKDKSEIVRYTNCEIDIHELRCTFCNETYISVGDLQRHLDVVHVNIHGSTVYKCSYCSGHCTRKDLFMRHLSWKHQVKVNSTDDLKKCTIDPSEVITSFHIRDSVICLIDLEDLAAVGAQFSDVHMHTVNPLAFSLSLVRKPEIISLSSQECIESICDDVYDRMKHRNHSFGYFLLNSQLPRLLKVFAIKFGTETFDSLPCKTSRLRIMRHFEKYLGQIIIQLRARLDQQNSHSSQRRVGEDSSMSVYDKMKMWNQCLDAEEELPSFSNVIQTSSAYQWLLAAVVQQASLSWRVSVADRVRVNILRSLVTTHVKHNDAPLPFRVSFRLRWEPVQAWVDREGRTSNTNLGPPLLSSLMVLTFVSGDEVQACTTEQYIRQVWPEGGVELLEPLQKLLDLETDCPSSLKSYKDSAGNIFSLEGSQLAITVCGPAHIIAQCGEQLSWLASAAQPGNPETAICTPCIKAIGWRKFSIEPRVEPHADAAGSLLLLTKPLRLLYERLASSCLVRGFAIAHRPEGVPGLELPWKTLLTVLQKPFLEPTCSHGYRLLRGTHTTLMLVKVISGVSMWYVVSSASLARVCSSSCLDQLQRENIQSVTMERLADLRHVINTCESVNAPTLHDSCHLKGSEKKVVDAATEYENHEAAAQYEEEFSSGSGAVQSLADISIDSDILSCSSSSQEAQLKQPVGDDKLSTIVAAVVNQLLADVKTSIFNRSTPTDGEYSNNGGSGSSTSTSSGTISLATGSQGGFQGTAQKRVISQRNSDEPGEDDSQRPPHKIQKQAQEIPQSTYACPFWKFDPVKYRTCFFLTLRTASRVKQHLIRKHVPEFYCQRCNAIFKSYEMHNEHVMDPSGYSCTPNPSERLDGITIHQNRLLSQKSRSLNEKDKWFDIWDILFPSCPRPSSPYVDVQLAEDCALFQEYSLKAGPDLVAQEIEASDALSTELAEDDRRELLRRAIAAGLIAIVETWSQTQEHPMNRNSNALLCSGRQGDEDLSGIGLSVTPIGSAPDSCGLRASHTPEGSTSQPIHPLEKPAENQTESSVNHSGEKQGNGSLVATAGVLVRDERCESLHDAHVRNSPTPQFEQSLRVEDSSFADVFTGDFASLFSIEPQLTFGTDSWRTVEPEDSEYE